MRFGLLGEMPKPMRPRPCAFVGRPLVSGMPGFAAVGGFEKAAGVAFERVAGGPWRAARRPQICVDDLRIFGIEGEVGGAGVVIFVENFLPVCAAVSGTEDAAFGIRAVGMAEHGYENAIGILRVNDDGGDLLAVAQAEVLPGFSAVGGFVNAVASGKIGAAQAFAAADIDDVGIGWRYG